MGDDCDQSLRELQVYLDGELRPEVRDIVAAHLADCPPCEDRAEFERRVRALVAASCHECAPVELRERILRLLNS
jgi:mycothiol system anti-sigma-R factor